MKYKTLALSSLALAASSAAFAQTSSPQLSIYGVLDANVQVLDGASKQTRVQSGGLSGSRIGLRGSEDLGGGLQAFFTLESGVNLDDGTNGQNAFWGRQAYVGLGSRYGKVSLGRQYSSLYTLTDEFSQFSNLGTGASTGVIGGFGGYEPVRGSNNSATGNGGPSRVNNSVKLESANYGGFSAGALWGMGEVAGNTNGTRIADVYGRYTGHGLDAMVSVLEDKADALGQNLRTLSAAAAYDWGSFRFNGGVMKVDDRSANNFDGKGYWLGASYRLGQHQFKGQYVESKNDGALADGKTQAFGVGYQYDLSKRTALYSSVTRFKNDGVGYTSRAAGAIPVGLVDADHHNLTEVVAGIRHSF
ncbi:porin [Roseateles cellulosilyticus]|uniref:Porin n=1 Tax=Pelomonas cellulosilytica TaxID=2906762 RepID=A0ABS8XZ95_9BURK|nr:porin [Pelomonas sp. P8]MCE4557000.1 porin [Pelomonas sp. P8]